MGTSRIIDVYYYLQLGHRQLRIGYSFPKATQSPSVGFYVFWYNVDSDS